MQKNNTRQRRIAQLLQEEITMLLRSEVHDPELNQAVITAVKMSNDLSHAKVYISDICEDIKVRLEACKKAAKFLRFHLAKQLDLRIVPSLTFIADTSLSHGNQLSRLINDVCDEDERNAQHDDRPAD